MDTQDQTSKPVNVPDASAHQSGASTGNDVKSPDGSGGHPGLSTSGEPSTLKDPQNGDKNKDEDFIVDDDVEKDVDEDEEEEEEEDDEDDDDDDEEEEEEEDKKEEDGDKGRNEETRKLLKEFSALMGTDSMKDFVFACGGSLPIASEQQQSPPQPADAKVSPEQPESKERRASVSSTSSHSSLLTVSSCKSVTLRWDPSDAATPASSCKLVFPLEPATSANLGKLVTSMAPASFGLGGKDVYDETYRKALKLDPTQFSIDFCPYEYGIIDAIAQVLLPTLNVKLANMRGVRAELYKLNIYAGPSGHFRSHVDTPRSATQFGSLVICLPLTHEGGQLEVRHQSTKTVFDWSKQDENQPAIQWAAFYSDCEHEVFEVKSGYRATLTYNLYSVYGGGHITGHCKTLDSAQAPLYKHAHAILNNKEFMPEGGYLGYHTVHAYPHSSEVSCLPQTLKGLDMAMWECFQSLGCGVCLRPVVKDTVTSWREEKKQILPSLEIHTVDYEVDDMKELEDMLFLTPQDKNAPKTDVAWLNEPGHEEFQIGYVAYGNQACLETMYSACAIIVSIPPWQEGVGRRRFKNTNDRRFDDMEFE